MPFVLIILGFLFIAVAYLEVIYHAVSLKKYKTLKEKLRYIVKNYPMWVSYPDLDGDPFAFLIIIFSSAIGVVLALIGIGLIK